MNVATTDSTCALSLVDEVVGSGGEPRVPLGVRIFRSKHRKLFARVISG